MMRVLFVQNLWFEFMGTMLIAAQLKARGHYVAVAVIDRPEQLDAWLARERPELVAVSLLPGGEPFAARVVERCRRGRVPVVLGGPTVTLQPADQLRRSGARYACVGAGEEALAALCDSLERGEDRAVPGIWQMPEGSSCPEGGGFAPTPRGMPWADRTIYRPYRRLWHQPLAVFVARGCSERCTYCANTALRDVHAGDPGFLRRRPVDDLLREAALLRDTLMPLRRNRHFVIGADNLNASTRWFDEFLRRWPGEVGAPFICYLKADRLEDGQIEQLVRAGAALVGFGVESGSPRVLREVLGRSGDLESIARATRALRRRGVRVLAGSMIAAPGETLEEGLDTYQLNLRLRADVCSVNLLQPYPGTALHAAALAQGQLPAARAAESLPTMHDDSLFEGPDVDALVNLHRLFLLGQQARIPRWLMRRLCRLPRNVVYEGLFLAAYALIYTRKNLDLSWGQTAFLALKHARFRPRRRRARQGQDSRGSSSSTPNRR